MVHRVPTCFQPILRQEVILTTLEQKCVVRALGAFPKGKRGFYRLCRLLIYKRLELGRCQDEGLLFIVRDRPNEVAARVTLYTLKSIPVSSSHNCCESGRRRGDVMLSSLIRKCV
ncbi:hypothetical protein RchiOBHm_Chr6g0278891 [Rosa chinensis]|uniref:Uncharacterized protein n=1 Tax=Rosa chinensis TaxID=74649 RepID=A0A2P6PSX7_ROSCH|nr:hypothetical protein RchiOBHm_Chr6g0278891 [Rosa chinensis]